MNGARTWLASLAGGAAFAAAIIIPSLAAAGPAPAPDRLAPVRVAPASVAPGQLAPGRVRPGEAAPGRVTARDAARTVSAWVPSSRPAADPVAGLLIPSRPAGRPAAAARPDFAARVTARVRCGVFTGTVQHGGDGSVLFPAFITVTGRVSSTCTATITARVGYELDFVHQGPLTLGKAGPRKTVTIGRLHRQTRLATSYQDIFVQACSGGRRLTCGAPVHV
jgi:hypothetical protein